MYDQLLVQKDKAMLRFDQFFFQQFLTSFSLCKMLFSLVSTGFDVQAVQTRRAPEHGSRTSTKSTQGKVRR